MEFNTTLTPHIVNTEVNTSHNITSHHKHLTTHIEKSHDTKRTNKELIK